MSDKITIEEVIEWKLSGYHGYGRLDHEDLCDLIISKHHQIAERDAALAECVKELKELRGVACTTGGVPLAASIDLFLARLQSVAKANARIIEASEEHARFNAYDDDTGAGFCTICEAVRAKKELK